MLDLIDITLLSAGVTLIWVLGRMAGRREYVEEVRAEMNAIIADRDRKEFLGTGAFENFVDDYEDDEDDYDEGLGY